MFCNIIGFRRVSEYARYFEVSLFRNSETELSRSKIENDNVKDKFVVMKFNVSFSFSPVTPRNNWNILFCVSSSRILKVFQAYIYIQGVSRL